MRQVSPSQISVSCTHPKFWFLWRELTSFGIGCTAHLQNWLLITTQCIGALFISPKCFLYLFLQIEILAVEENSVTHRMGIWRCVRCKAVVVADGVEQTWPGCYSLRLTLSQGHVVSGWKPHLYLPFCLLLGRYQHPPLRTQSLCHPACPPSYLPLEHGYRPWCWMGDWQKCKSTIVLNWWCQWGAASREWNGSGSCPNPGKQPSWTQLSRAVGKPHGEMTQD